MKYSVFLLVTLCSALVTGGSVVITLVLLRLKSKAVIESEYIVLPPSASEMNAEQPKSHVLQSI